MDNRIIDIEDIILSDELTPTQEPDTIRPNSPSLLIDETTSRFNSALWANKISNVNVMLAGLGGIGSWTALLLSRLKPGWIYVFDGDTVELGNMSGQLYGITDVGKSKADSIRNIMRNFSSYSNGYFFSHNYTEESSSNKIMICGFDNMASRKLYYEKWKSGLGLDKDKALFIDGRLAAEEFQVFCIKGDDTHSQKIYEDKWLFSDEEAEETVCSFKQTSHCACMIASVMVNLLVNFIANQCEPLIERDVPFLTSYNAETMYFKTES